MGHVIKVIMMPGSEMVGKNGEYRSGELKILIDKDVKQSQIEATLIHEVLHCININMDEEKVEWLAQSLYQVLSDNKMLK